jgi:hypothetical protein
MHNGGGQWQPELPLKIAKDIKLIIEKHLKRLGPGCPMHCLVITREHEMVG